jgi:hypothetical protein
MVMVSKYAAASDARDRHAHWLAWMNHTRTEHAALARFDVPPDVRDFFINHYSANEPALIELTHWPALDWTLESLKHRLGDTPVEVQTNRVSDSDYEIRPHLHKQVMAFSAFIDRITSGPDNDVYLTGRNAAQNRIALAPLFADIAPLPTFLWPDADVGQLWLGGRTVTPLHHDLCNTLLCQIIGRKHVRLIRPYQARRLENHTGVYSRLGWVTDEMAAARGLVLKDFVLTPGQALFLPVGWWHCVRALDPSVSITFNHFMWNNRWEAGFPPG